MGRTTDLWAGLVIQTKAGPIEQLPRPKTFLETIAELEEIGETYPIIKEKLDAALTELQRSKPATDSDSGPTITL